MVKERRTREAAKAPAGAALGFPFVKALRRFTVRAALPPALQPLADLVMNLRWSWHPESLDLFAGVDPESWESCGHDPVSAAAEY